MKLPRYFIQHFLKEIRGVSNIAHNDKNINCMLTTCKLTHPVHYTPSPTSIMSVTLSPHLTSSSKLTLSRTYNYQNRIIHVPHGRLVSAGIVYSRAKSFLSGNAFISVQDQCRKVHVRSSLQSLLPSCIGLCYGTCENRGQRSDTQFGSSMLPVYLIQCTRTKL